MASRFRIKGLCSTRASPWQGTLAPRSFAPLDCAISLKFQGSGVGFMGFGFRVSVFGFPISGFRFRVRGFGTLVSGFNCKFSFFCVQGSGFGL